MVLPTLRWKYTDTLAHTFLSTLHALFQRFDVILICNAANSMYAWMPRIFGIPVAVNVDGIERKRRKWNWLGRSFYRMSERFSVWFPNAIVTDARVIEKYYLERYGAPSVFIPYGAVTERPRGHAALDALGLAAGQYFLYVSRLEPENNAHVVVRAFERIRTDRRLVVVGDAPYAPGYIRSLKQTTDARIQFPGSIYGQSYWELMANAYCYIHATEVGGTHPALIEAMGQGNLIISNSTPENSEVLGDAGILYKKNDIEDLAHILQDVENHPASYEPLRNLARERVLLDYAWPGVVTRYERLFSDLVERRPAVPGSRQSAEAGSPGPGD